MALNFSTGTTRITDLLSDASAATVTLGGALLNETIKIVYPYIWNDREWTKTFLTAANDDTIDISGITNYSKMRTVKAIPSNTTWTTDWTTSNKLVDSTASFWSALLGKIVYNSTDNTEALVTAVDSATTLSVSADIFTSWESYVLWDWWVHYIANEVSSEEEWNILKGSSPDSTSNVLSNFFVRDQVLELYLTPWDSTTLIVVTYQQLTTDLTWTDAIPIPEQFQEALVYRPLYLLFMRREELWIAREYKALWEKEFKKIKKFWSSKTKWIAGKMKSRRRFIDVDASRDDLITK